MKAKVKANPVEEEKKESDSAEPLIVEEVKEAPKADDLLSVES